MTSIMRGVKAKGTYSGFSRLAEARLLSSAQFYMVIPAQRARLLIARNSLVKYHWLSRGRVYRTGSLDPLPRSVRYVLIRPGKSGQYFLTPLHLLKWQESTRSYEELTISGTGPNKSASGSQTKHTTSSKETSGGGEWGCSRTLTDLASRPLLVVLTEKVLARTPMGSSIVLLSDPQCGPSSTEDS